MKVSVICTVKDEETSIKDFLMTLVSQSRKPDEIIIVDGGSTDGTVEIIRSFLNEATINLIVSPGANISQGRNLAISHAKFDHVASADAGTKLYKDWLRNLTKPFEDDPTVDVVAGYFVPEFKSTFEECVGKLLYPKLELMKWDRFLPSGRSTAFKKKCWQKVGGYPEFLDFAEDSLFDIKLKNTGFKFAYAKDAVVYWRSRKNIEALFRQYYLYSKGSSEGGFGSKFLIEAYGTNSIVYLLRNLMRLASEKRIMTLFYVLPVIVTVLGAKILGAIVGNLWSRHKRV